MSRIKNILLLLLIPSYLVFGWGDKGHKLITKQALELLGHELKLSDEIKAAIIQHCVDPDNRKKEDKTEGPKHFIDIDYYKEFLDGHMIKSKDSLINIYGEDVVTKQGILPWATENSFAKLVEAFKSKNKDAIVLYASDLAHYVGDGHQPLHACLNYNGQLTSQKGVHFRYEIEMLDKYLPEMESALIDRMPIKVNDLPSFIFDYITESNMYVDLLLSADNIAYKFANQNYDEAYYKQLWFRTKYVTNTEINEGAFALSSLIYTAWIDAGKPDLEF